jgi:hypothetical protein
MAWRVRIVPDVTVDGIAIQAAERHATGPTVQRVWTWREELVEPGVEMPAPSITMDDDLARALLDALSDHYRGTSTGRQDRADFEYERARVDRLLGHLIGAQP